MSKELINLVIALVISILLVAVALCGIVGFELLIAKIGLNLDHLISSLLLILAVVSIKEKF